MLLRVFAALPVPPEVRDLLTDLQTGLNEASWRPEENFHITLRFFGELDHSTIRDLDHELGLIEAPQIELVARDTGWFGSKEPHSVWAGVEGVTDADTAALKRLASRCERAARRVGLSPEPRPFRPHITLAYLHGTPLDQLGAYTTRNAGFRSPPFWADRFHLYSSHETAGPTRYEAQADYPLGALSSPPGLD